MCHMIVGGGGGVSPASSGVGSRSPASGLLRVGLHERGHVRKVGLGLGCVRSFLITCRIYAAHFVQICPVVLEGIV